MLSLKQVNDDQLDENEEIECDDACKAFRTYSRHLLDIFESELVKDAKSIIKRTAATFQKFYNYCVDENEIKRWDNFLRAPNSLIGSCWIDWIEQNDICGDALSCCILR